MHRAIAVSTRTLCCGALRSAAVGAAAIHNTVGGNSAWSGSSSAHFALLGGAAGLGLMGVGVAAATADSEGPPAGEDESSAVASTQDEIARPPAACEEEASSPTTPTTPTTITTTTTNHLITEAELAEHCTAESCWLAIEGSVYDVTRFLSAHPGGAGAVLAAAGADATAQFTAFHRKTVLSEVAAQYVCHAYSRCMTPPHTHTHTHTHTNPRLFRSSTNHPFHIGEHGIV
jgi:hypothetical protein